MQAIIVICTNEEQLDLSYCNSTFFIHNYLLILPDLFLINLRLFVVFVTLLNQIYFCLIKHPTFPTFSKKYLD